jgi:hypothetical protein
MVGFVIRSYEEIVNGTGKEDGFTDTKATLRGEHKAETSAGLPQPRRHQIQFIETSLPLLAPMRAKKARVLTSLMLIELCIMAATYGESIFDALKVDSKTRKGSLLGTGATYFRSLLINIGVSEQNKLEPEDIKSLLRTAEDFIESMVYVDGDSAKGFKYKDEKNAKEGHPFAEIEGLDISQFLKTCSDVIHESNTKIIVRNSLQYSQNLQAVENAKKEEARIKQEAEAERQAQLNGPGYIQNISDYVKNLRFLGGSSGENRVVEEVHNGPSPK